MKTLLYIAAAAIAAAGLAWFLKYGQRDTGLDTVASRLHQPWSARFRNVTPHAVQGRIWLCGEVSRPGAQGFERFIVPQGADTPVIEELNAEALQWGWQRYCQ